jgi:hypothetical protein
MRDLLFVTDVSQLPAALGRLAAEPVTHLVTSDLAVAAELEDRGVPFVDLWQLVSNEEFAANLRLTVEISRRWWDARWGSVELAGRPLPEVAEQEWMWPVEICLNSEVAFERLLDGEPVRRVRGYFLPPAPIHRALPAPIFRAATTLSQAVLFHRAELHGIPVTGLSTLRPLTREARRAAPRLVPRRPLPTEGTGPGERTVVLLECGMRAAEVLRLEEWFAGHRSWRVVRLSQNHLEFPALAGRPSPADSASRRLWECWGSYRALSNHPFPAIFANRHLEFQVRRIWEEIDRAVRAAGVFAAVLDVVAPDLVVLGHDAYSLERCLVRTAHQRGIPTASLLHTGLRHATGYLTVSGEAERLLVWSDVDMEDLARCGVERARLAKVGSLQFHDRWRSGGAATAPAERADARRALGLRPDAPLVLLATAATSAGLTMPIANPRELRRAWRELVALARRRPGLTFAIKPHPSYDYNEFYRRLYRSGPRNVTFFEDVDLVAALRAADVLVLFNYCSTAGLEAMIARVPVVFLRNALVEHPEVHDSLGGRGVVSASTTAELEAAIDRLLGDTEARDELLRQAEAVVVEFVGDPAVPALERVAAVLEATARGPAPARPIDPSPAAPTVDPARRFAAAVVAGATAAGARELRAGIAAIPPPRREAETDTVRLPAALPAGLAALATAVDRGQTGLARRLALGILVRFPLLCLRSPLLLRRVLSCVALRSLPVLHVRTWLARLRDRWPARYLRVEVPPGSSTAPEPGTRRGDGE